MYFFPFQMSTNSSFNNHSVLHLNLSSSNLSTTSGTSCFRTTEDIIVFASFLFTQCLLFMPLSGVVFLLGLKSWFKQWFESRPSTMSHSDAFMYHTAALQIMAFPGAMMMLYGLFQNQPSRLGTGYSLWSFGWYGETFFYLLTCTEHYLAVVHPISYRNLRKERGIRIRNITIGCVWLFNLGKVIPLLFQLYSYWFDLFTMFFLLVSLCFSFLSILLVLTGSVVGKEGKKRRLNRSKKRAYYIIIVIQAILLMRCVLGLTFLFFSKMKIHFDCSSLLSALWINLPCSLTLPLFFLQRIGKLSCYNNNTS